MNSHPWMNIISRAVQLGVLPYGPEHTVRFKVFHSATCMMYDVQELYGEALSHADDYCDCTPAIMWREVCDISGHFNIIIDKSSSERGLI